MYFLQACGSAWVQVVRGKGSVHVTHRNHVVDFLDTEPVQDVGHECLEAHVLDTRDELCRFEVLVGGVTTPLPQVVDKVP